MASPGWYPDPAGSPNMFRYWDGASWSRETSPSPYAAEPGALPPPPTRPPPTQPPPTQPPPTRPPPSRPPPPPGPGVAWSAGPPAMPAMPAGTPPSGRGDGGGKRVALILLAVLLVAGVAVGGFFGVRALSDDSDAADRSAGDDTAESADDLPTVASSTSSPQSVSPETQSASPGEPSAAVTPLPTACGAGSPEGGKRAGAVLRGGGLRLPAPDGFDPSFVSSAFVFADKVTTVAREIEPQWVAVYALGGLDRRAGYTGLEQAAETVLSCMTDSPLFYAGFTGRTDQGSGGLTVDGQDAWRITAEVRVDNPDVTVDGDLATVIVVDTGSPRRYGLFVSVVPLGDANLIGQQEQLAGALTVD